MIRVTLSGYLSEATKNASEGCQFCAYTLGDGETPRFATASTP